MSSWSDEVLDRITGKDDLHIAPFREDGVTTGTPTWIWSVRVGGDLYVRAYNGSASRWYQAALRERAGRITADGETFDVEFSSVDEEAADSIDAAYRSKYGGNPYLGSMIAPRARDATIRVTPA